MVFLNVAFFLHLTSSYLLLSNLNGGGVEGSAPPGSNAVTGGRTNGVLRDFGLISSSNFSFANFRASFCSARCWDQILLAPFRDADTNSAFAAAFRLEKLLTTQLSPSLFEVSSSKTGLDVVRRNFGPSGSSPKSLRDTNGAKGTASTCRSSSFRAPFHANFQGERAILQKALLTVWV